MKSQDHKTVLKEMTLLSSGHTLEIGKWYTLRVTVEQGGAMKLYLNGQLDASADNTLCFADLAGPVSKGFPMLLLGARHSGRKLDHPFTGRIDEVRIWKGIAHGQAKRPHDDVIMSRTVTTPPAIDGKLDDTCWNTAERTQPFRLLGRLTADVPGGWEDLDTKFAKHAAVAQICHDAENLYVAYGQHSLCYATSRNGIDWDKPSLDVVPGTNIVRQEPNGANVVWLDLEERDPSRRYKLIRTFGGGDLLMPSQYWSGTKASMFTHFSRDGIHFSDAVIRTGITGDRNSAFWNPFRKTWVFSIRECSPYAPKGSTPFRLRRYWESPDLVTNTSWSYREPTMWMGADQFDHHKPYGKIPDLYNLDAVGYESVLLGLFTIHRKLADKKIGRPKINEVCVGFSRDGFHWDRTDRRSFLPVSKRQGQWNWGNVQSVGGGCLVVGDKLYFYVSGRKGNHPHFWDAGCSTGLAVLRRDGFASMDATNATGTLTTRKVQFTGKHCLVNVAAKSGELRAEILDATGQVIPPFSRGNCTPVTGDRTLSPVAWKGTDDLSNLAGKPVKFRFYVRNAQLYAFWVSPDPSGASHGYVAAGGPGFTGPTDTVGSTAARTNPAHP